jgi:hypothetical protein
MGTHHRNHCPRCLWSKHVDEKTGDRASLCQAGMQPIGFTLKKEGKDKFTGKEKFGDVMVVHECTKCHKININRVAADDDAEVLMNILKESMGVSSETRQLLRAQGIDLIDESTQDFFTERIFGSTNPRS